MLSTILNFLMQQRGSRTWARERIFTTSYARSPSSSCVMRLHNSMLSTSLQFPPWLAASFHYIYHCQQTLSSSAAHQQPIESPASTAASSSPHNPAIIIITISGPFTTSCFAVWEMWLWILVFIMWRWGEGGGGGGGEKGGQGGVTVHPEDRSI